VILGSPHQPVATLKPNAILQKVWQTGTNVNMLANNKHDSAPNGQENARRGKQPARFLQSEWSNVSLACVHFCPAILTIRGQPRRWPPVIMNMVQ
jgi:hypothetical protein